ncbi:MAG: hypothetical protein HS114_37275 [Anaerolineales bacterium]|nr:hypothetical protein [Anaerolineales bacterium]
MMVVIANMRFPAVTAQDVGREVYHGRQEAVCIVGDERSLSQIAWIFQRVPDMFEVQRYSTELIVRRGRR